MRQHKVIFIRQDDVVHIPSSCFDTCNAIVKVGATIPMKSICDSDEFKNAFYGCIACAMAAVNRGDTSQMPDPLLDSLLLLCHLGPYTTEVSASTTSNKSTVTSLLPPPTTTTNGIPKSLTTSWTTTVGTSFSMSISYGSQGIIPIQPVPTTPLQFDSGNNKPSSNAWLAGPVVSAIVAFATTLGVLFYFWKRYRRTKQQNSHKATHGQAPLQSNTNGFYELVTFPMPPRAEMSANEAAAAELSQERSVFELSTARNVS